MRIVIRVLWILTQLATSKRPVSPSQLSSGVSSARFPPSYSGATTWPMRLLVVDGSRFFFVTRTCL